MLRINSGNFVKVFKVFPVGTVYRFTDLSDIQTNGRKREGGQKRHLTHISKLYKTFLANIKIYTKTNRIKSMKLFEGFWDHTKLIWHHLKINSKCS